MVIEYLSDSHNAVMDCINDEGWSPLHLACFRGHFSVVEFFLRTQKYIMNRRIADSTGRTPLILAAATGYIAVVDTLVAHGVELDRSDKAGKSPLWWASCKFNCLLFPYHHRQSFFHSLISPSRLPLPSPPFPSIHRLSVMGHVAIIESLLTAGANPLQPDRDSNNPLHAACMTGRLPAIMFLVHRYNGLQHNHRNNAGHKRC